MSSKRLKRLVEPDSLPDVQPVSDSDDLSSPECLLSLQPVEDDYFSDDEARKKSRKKVASPDKFIKDHVIHSHDVLPWEMEYYLQANFNLCEATQCMVEPLMETFVEESFKFVFPNGVPEEYIGKYGLNTQWKVIASKLCEDFFAKEKKYQWLRENYTIDYTKPEEKRACFFQRHEKERKKTWTENRERSYSHIPALLAARMHQVISYIMEDEARESTADREKNEKSDKIKGMLYELMAYLEIPALYNGENKLHFDYNFTIPGRTIRGPAFKMKPDVTMCTQSWPTGNPVPYCTVQVYGSFDTKALGRIGASDESLSENLLGKSDLERQIKTSVTLEDKDNTNQIQRKPTTDKEKGMKLENEDIDKQQEEERTNEATSVEGIIHLDKKTPAKIHDQISKKTPFASSFYRDSDAGFKKLAGKSAMDMYGLLVNKLKLEDKKDKDFESESNFMALGLFVMNDRVYLSKIIHDVYSLHRLVKKKAILAEIEIGPQYNYTKWFFNLKRPADRFGFMIFLHHYSKIMEKQNPI